VLCILVYVCRSCIYNVCVVYWFMFVGRGYIVYVLYWFMFVGRGYILCVMCIGLCL